MKKLFLAIVAFAFAAPTVSAQVHVKGYTRSDGTYVAPHYRSSPNSTTADNWTTRGNVNPYTGTTGTRSPEVTRSPNTTNPYKPVCYYNCPK